MYILDTWYLTPVFDMLYLALDPRHLISDTDIWHVILGTWSKTFDIWHRYLTCYHLTPDTWHWISDTGTDMFTLDTWSLTLDIWHRHWYVILDTWYLTLNIWHQYLTCYYFTHDIWHRYLTWHLISNTDTWHVITWHPIPDTWYIYDTCQLTCYHLLDMCYYLLLTHLTWYCDTWLDSITPDTCIMLHIHDYHLTGTLAWLLYCYQTSGAPELLNSCTPELRYPLYSCPLHCYSC